MVKAVVTGAAGRMGGRIISHIAGTDGIRLVGAVERKGHPLIGKDVGEYLGLGATGVVLEEDLAKCVEAGDVVIDFTHRDVVMDTIRIANEKERAIVVGTTGLTVEETAEIKDIVQNTRCVLAPNMSVGVNVMFKVLENVATILGDQYDVEIVEAHHNLKKDAPSGTAVKMAQIIADSLGRNLEDVGIYGRKGMIGERPKNEIGIQTVRAGDIVGEHTVIFGGVGERLEFIHRAHSRDNFVKGAIRAAMWIVDQEKGLYDMQDVLGLKNM
jgi:4-hydroxy-tetrahydrodipicolinate reductase